ncbi:hypothetical protein D3C77_575060 [compost metagenome]
MAGAVEKRLVQHRDLEHGNLQARDQRLERVRQGSVVENELEKHRDQVDDIVIHPAHHPRLAAFRAGATEQVVDLLAQIDHLLAARGFSRHTVLQMGKQPHQVLAGDRQGVGAGRVSRSADIPALGQQLL